MTLAINIRGIACTGANSGGTAARAVGIYSTSGPDLS